MPKESLKNSIMVTKNLQFERKRRRQTKAYQEKIRRGGLSLLEPNCGFCSHDGVFQRFPEYLRIKVLPKSAKTEIVDTLDDGTIKIRVAAPPEKGKANTELIKFLAKHFKVEKSAITIISGKSDQLKLVKIEG